MSPSASRDLPDFDIPTFAKAVESDRNKIRRLAHFVMGDELSSLERSIAYSRLEKALAKMSDDQLREKIEGAKKILG